MVFTSYLEGLGDAGEAIQSTYMQAAKAISRILDNMLDVPPSMSGTTPGTTVPASISCDNLDAPFSPSQFLQPGPDTTGFPHFDLLNSNALDGFDFSSGLDNVAWTGNYVG